MNQQAGGSPLRILFVAPYVPNLIRVRPYNLIRALHRAGHQITLLTFFSNERERKDANELSAYCVQVVALPLSRLRSIWNCLLAIPGSTPLQAAYCWQPAGAAALDSLLGRDNPTFDIVHVEHLRGVRYALHAQQSKKQRIPVIWDSVDCISLLFRQASSESNRLVSRLMSRLELGRTEKYEGFVSGQFPRVLVTSEQDRAALAQLAAASRPSPDGAAGSGDLRFQVLPNGVDLSYFQPIPFEDRSDLSLVVSGKMSYHANVTMVLNLVNEIMPRVWARQPAAKLTIVGKDPAREIIALAQHSSVTVTGSVPDIRPYIQQAAIALAPLAYGVGIQNKVLEALACGVPTITTSQAARSFAAGNHRPLLVADDPEEFAVQTLYLLDNPERRRALGQAGRAYVENHHDWDVVAKRLARIYRDAIPSTTDLNSQRINRELQ